MLPVVQASSTDILKQGSDDENGNEKITSSNRTEKEQIGIWSKSERATAVEGNKF